MTLKFLIQLGVGGLCAVGTAVTLFFMITNEINFNDSEFAKYFAALGLIAFISFIVLTQNDDNEETNPIRDKK